MEVKMEYTEVPVDSLMIGNQYKLVIYGDPTYTTGTLSAIHYDKLIYRTKVNCIQFYQI